MAIKKSFGGQSIRKPGSYSKSSVDNTAGRELTDNGSLFLIGEADLGAPGDVEGIQRFTASQLNDLIAKYGSGPLVDCAIAAVRAPSISPGIAGADEVLVWKTNSSTQASKNLLNGASAAVLVVKDRFWGALGNQISITIANGSSANQKALTIKRNDIIESLGENDAVAQLSIQYTGSGSAASATISGATPNAKILATVCTGDAGSNLSLNLSNFASMSELASYIDNLANYSATLLNTQSGSVKSPTELDNVTIADIKTSAISLYRLQVELKELINDNSALILAELPGTLAEGVPANLTNSLLSGGAKGASVNSDFTGGFDKALGETWEVAVPCISQDASADITAGLTDSSSTYTIAAVLSALRSHLILRGTVKNRKEAQGNAGFRNSSKSSCYSQAQSVASELVQLCIQDVLVQGVDGELSWKQPHILAALAAGARLGSVIGEPLTFKYPNIAAFGHAVNPDTGISAGNFDPEIDVDDGIDNGILFVEKSAGGSRFVVDNTTYGADDSFVFNRGSVVEAAQYVAKTLRQQTEAVFVGRKISNGQASSIKNFMRGLLLELNRNEIITSSDDAPQGFREDTFVVEIDGNTARVQVEVKPVQGMDFILIDITLGDISQSA